MNKTATGVKIVAMVIVISFSLFVGYGIGYTDGFEDGYIEGWYDCLDAVNEVLAPFIFSVYSDGYVDGFGDGFFWGWVEAWRIWGGGENFYHPHFMIPVP